MAGSSRPLGSIQELQKRRYAPPPEVPSRADAAPGARPKASVNDKTRPNAGGQARSAVRFPLRMAASLSRQTKHSLCGSAAAPPPAAGQPLSPGPAGRRARRAPSRQGPPARVRPLARGAAVVPSGPRDLASRAPGPPQGASLRAHSGTRLPGLSRAGAGPRSELHSVSAGQSSTFEHGNRSFRKRA